MTSWYPVCLDLTGKPCLVVGGGPVALEKARGLHEAGAAVTVVAPAVVPKLRALDVELVERPFADSDVRGHMLVVSTTGEDAVAARVAAAAARAGVFCNAADVPALCSFILPAVHREGPILVAVSTGGASPALAQWLRARIAELVRPEHAQLAERLAALRPWAKRQLPSYEERRDYFQRLVERALA